MMNLKLKNLILLALLMSAVVLMSACNAIGSSQSSSSSVSSANVVAGNGANYSGVGALSVPTAEGVVARIQNGLGGNVSALSGNFKTALAQVKANLPKTADPTKASGFDQVQRLVYAACSDLTTGGSPMMLSKYNVDPKKSVADNNSALVAAGVSMMDQYTAGLASQSSASAAVTSVFTTLLSQTPSDITFNSTVAFMSVCIAANSAGTTLLGM